jgi:decaprenyl-phosphate phosphoribosyltransferase
MSAIIKLCRPQQWVKNGFVFIPLLFSKLYIQPESVYQAIIVFFIFSIASSAAYIVNDIKDIEKDRLHPHKKWSRPLASGEIRVRTAVLLLSILYGSMLLISYFRLDVMKVVFGYLILNLIYTFKLKNQPVFDVFTIAFGFVLRVVAGGVAIGSGVSHWMFIVTLCLALFLACVKRRQELINSRGDAREVLGKYTLPLLNRYAELAATCTVVFYGLFVAMIRPGLVLTVPIMLFGLFRYWFNVESCNAGESPTDVLLSDRVLQGVIFVWGALTAYLLLVK